MRSILYVGLFLFFNTGNFFLSDDHAIYLSTLEISEDNGALNLMVKVFEDDLRDALKNSYNQVIDPHSDAFNFQVETYFQSHIKLKIGENQLLWQLSSIELVGDSYQIGFASPATSSEGSISMEVSYFYELFPTQQNVLNLQLRSTKKYHIFKSGNRMKKFNF